MVDAPIDLDFLELAENIKLRLHCVPDELMQSSNNMPKRHGKVGHKRCLKLLSAKAAVSTSAGFQYLPCCRSVSIKGGSMSEDRKGICHGSQSQTLCLKSTCPHTYQEWAGGKESADPYPSNILCYGLWDNGLCRMMNWCFPHNQLFDSVRKIARPESSLPKEPNRIQEYGLMWRKWRMSFAQAMAWGWR